jgi:hypothetical protein
MAGTSFSLSGNGISSPGMLNQTSTQAVSNPQTVLQPAFNPTNYPGVASLGTITGLLQSQGGKQTVTSADGSSVTHSINPPKIPAGGLPLASGVTPITNVAEAQKAGAAVNPNNQTTTPPQTTNQVNQPATPVPSPYAAAVKNVTNTGNTAANNIVETANNSPYNQGLLNSTQNLTTTAAGNIPLGQNATTIAQNAGNQISAIGQETAGTAGGYLTGGLSGPQALGGAAVQQQTGAAQTQAIAAGANMALQGNQQALTAQNQAEQGYGAAGTLAGTGLNTQVGAAGTAGTIATGAAQSAASLQQPVTQYGMLTDPTTGQPISPYAQSLVQDAVSSYQNYIANGATPADAMTYSGLGNYGALGTEALNQATGAISGTGTFNPTAVGAAATQNVTQGAAYQGQASALSVALTGLSSVAPTLQSLLSQDGLNTATSPSINALMNTSFAQTNPAGVASLKAAMGEIQNYVSQILGSTGDLTPTQVTALTNGFDPGNFNGPELKTFLANLDNYGQIRLSSLQGASNQSYGSPTTAYSGTTATPSSTSVPSTPQSATNGLTPFGAANAVTGAGLDVGSAVANAAKTQGGAAVGGALLESIFG